MNQTAERVNGALILAIVAVATVGGFMFGFDSGVINGTHKGLAATFGVGALGEGLLTGALLVGCAIGAFSAGRLADVIGRRNVMILAAILFIISALGSGAAGSPVLFILARFIGGLGVGAASVTAPVYISEVTPARTRGRMSSIQQVMIITGLTGAFVSNYFFQQAAGADSTADIWGFPAWRWMLWVQVIPATVYLLALFTIPESPRYLVVKGRDDDARKVLTNLFGATAADLKVAEIRNSLSADHRPRLSDILDPVRGGLRPIIWAGLMLAIFQQLVGINVIFYYGATLWQLAGFSEADALRNNIVSGGVSIAACIFTILVIDKIGRKPLLLIGSAGMSVALFAMVYAFSTGHLENGKDLVLEPNMGIFAFYAANAYVIFFNLSWGPVMWVMLGEMFPNQIRGSALAVCGLAQWTANFAISLTFPSMAANLGLTLSYSFYAVCAVISFFLVSKLIQETKGKELEAMEG
ncbi:SP family sugar:H+ symporter-like MFS transporter [Sphingomonas naasensis]|uniref:MFS transporter n=1 Tax=Sphingomonas naasensis TaxID=1344951 RepID=A0A4S1WKL1_9SPHN|nr:sugar porter family MFS transporter [Sphingomonas naasensis]NIJ20868.1 SP family sugar:H+ symporter-like MFS transporter [Sphingomonas naasensis]TGX43263.1 MFS transporter [Sphingomonas naasensis]